MKRDSVLVLGAGNNRIVRAFPVFEDEGYVPSGPEFKDNFTNVTTIDMDPYCRPDIVWNLNDYPWPVKSEGFDQVHAYEVLEHLTAQGDYQGFFELWEEIWRVLKPGGYVVATTPWWQSMWVWQDPGHKMCYSPGILMYLSQKQYAKQVGSTAMTDYRAYFPPPLHFDALHWVRTGDEVEMSGFTFVLQKGVYKSD